ncbi:MAG: hypothetical protein FGM24_00525 [Candidatus Kapabacteria bacterium]|nr:hypothetical protein [Candidatus Kapabacteria bacterium]
MIRFVMLCLAAAATLTAQTMPLRRELQLSDTLRRVILDGIWTSAHPTFGYAPTEMEQYGPDPFLLRNVRLLFNDVLSVPRMGGTTSKNLLAATDIAALIRTGYGLTDVSAGRFLPLPDSSNPTVDSMPAALPFHVRRLVAHINAALDDAAPWYRKAIAETPIERRLRDAPATERARKALALAQALWRDDRLDQMATSDVDAMPLLRTFDRRSMAFASVILAAHLDSALKEYRSADSAQPFSGTGRWRIVHPMGTILITGSTADTITAADDAMCVIDLGGNDLYIGAVGCAIGPSRPFGIVVDMGGDDRYTAQDDTLSIGSAVFGVSLLVDVAGSDIYHGLTSSIGSAWFGTAAVIDMRGNDQYTVDGIYGQGAGTAGVGLVDDRAGDDVYIIAAEGQAFAQTYGAGLLVDRGGNDRYTARLDGAPSELYLGQSVSRAQGAAFGRRADLGDGHSLSGGVAMLADAAGDDIYTAAAWSQGCGYWWAAGFLEDLDGNDTYINGKYSLGAGAHFAIGCIADLRGDDAYNVDNDDAVNQYHGHARDGSIGVAFDGDGNDRYHFRSHCGGSADLGSIGLFWDRAGDDTYDVLFDPPADADSTSWANTPPMGTATVYEPFGTFRDDVLTVGVFIDGSGTDAYAWGSASGSTVTPKDGAVDPQRRTGNGRTSTLIRAPRSRGLFIDR